MNFETVSAIQAYRGKCEDQSIVLKDLDRKRIVVVVADGAGGVGSGDLAAMTVIREVKENLRSINTADEWKLLLSQTDFRITQGESTAVIVDIREYGIAGASVGDSKAWTLKDGEVDDLTKNQVRKPLLGSGRAEPMSFTRQSFGDFLIVGSDGFFDYSKPAEVTRLIYKSDFYSIPRKCIELVQLPSGEFWDDTSIIAVRRKPIQGRSLLSNV